MSEADFSPNARNAIAGRAGFRCSYPGCNRVTIGPCDDFEEFEQTGMACHIYSSAQDGPRGTGGLSVDERRKAANGIWCCYTHGKLIDNKEGVDFPAAILQQWKAAHEARISHEHRGIPVPFGWLSAIEIASSPLFVPNTRIDLGKVNLLVGPNGTGKTALCEMMAAAGGELRHLWRWKDVPPGRSPWDVQLRYACPDPHSFRGLIGNGKIQFSIDDSSAADINHGLRFIYLKDGVVARDAIDDVDRVARSCGIERDRVAQAIDHLQRLKLPFLNSVSIVDFIPDDDDELPADKALELRDALQRIGLSHRQQIRASIGGHKADFAFGQLSGREASITVMSVGIGLADLVSRHSPTVLMIDIGGYLLPDELLNVYVNALSRDRFRFQTILISPLERPKVDWTGWSVVSFDKRPPEVAVTQNQIRGPTVA